MRRLHFFRVRNEELAEKGYIIAVVEYRNSEIATFPAVALDTRNAIRFMKMHGAEYMVDIENIFVGGDSSGGHAAMFSQIIKDDDKDAKHVKFLQVKIKKEDINMEIKSVLIKDTTREERIRIV